MDKKERLEKIDNLLEKNKFMLDYYNRLLSPTLKDRRKQEVLNKDRLVYEEAKKHIEEQD